LTSIQDGGRESQIKSEKALGSAYEVMQTAHRARSDSGLQTLRKHNQHLERDVKSQLKQNWPWPFCDPEFCVDFHFTVDVL